MACDIHLSISTAYGDSYETDVDYVNLPTAFGSLGILRGHADMLCAVRPGNVRFTAGEEQGSVAVGEGVATVSNNQVIVLVSSMQGK
jgi:F-type H+-transporting ATPase subunit epsilon